MASSKEYQKTIKSENRNLVSQGRFREIKEKLPLFVLYDLDNMIMELAEEYENAKELTGEFSKKVLETSFGIGLQNHIPVAETVGDEYRVFLTEIVKGIISEYDCKGTTEIMLAETIACQYVKTLEYSKALSPHFTKGGVKVSKDINDHYRLLGKEHDRAHRQYINALMTLKQIKSPLLEVNIKTKTAFIAQNQQFNASNVDKSNEINDQQ